MARHRSVRLRVPREQDSWEKTAPYLSVVDHVFWRSFAVLTIKASSGYVIKAMVPSIANWTGLPP